MDKSRLASIEEKCTRTLIDLLVPLLLKIYHQLYACVVKTEPKDHMVLCGFQKALKETVLWNSLEIDKRVDLIMMEIPDLMEVLEAVFMVNAQLWGSVRLGSSLEDDDLTLQLPSKSDFVHKLVIKGAEKIYEEPSLFEHRTSRISTFEMRENRKRLTELIAGACTYTLEKCFPRGELLKKFLHIENEEHKKKVKPVIDDSDDESVVSAEPSVGESVESDDEGDQALGLNDQPRQIMCDSDSEDSMDSDDETEHIKKISTSMNRSDFGATAETPVLPPPPASMSATPQPLPPPPQPLPPPQHNAASSDII